jgi:hypothetical protein
MNVIPMDDTSDDVELVFCVAATTVDANIILLLNDVCS